MRTTGSANRSAPAAASRSEGAAGEAETFATLLGALVEVTPGAIVAGAESGDAFW
jgi:hypothetical protein